MNNIDPMLKKVADNGEMSASITLGDTSSTFSAERVDMYEIFDRIHVWGMAGSSEAEHRLILLDLPKMLDNGEHVITPQSQDYKALLSTEWGTSYAHSVDIMVDTWDSEKKRLELRFGFDGNMDVEAYSVKDGTLNISGCEAGDSIKQVAGNGSAYIKPEVFTDKEKFAPSEFLFSKRSSDYVLGAFQNINDSQQGVLFFIPADVQEGKEVKDVRAYFVVNKGLIPAQQPKFQIIQWNEDEQQIKVHFSFGFTYGGDERKVSQGTLTINY